MFFLDNLIQLCNCEVREIVIGVLSGILAKFILALEAWLL